MQDQQLIDEVTRPENGWQIASEGCADLSIEALFYSQLLNNSAAPALFVANPQNNFKLKLCSASACRLMGIEFETGVNLELSVCIPQLTPAKLNCLWNELRVTGMSSAEALHLSASGQRIALSVSFFLFELAGQTLMAGYVQDISERSVLEAECLRLVGQLANREVELRYREIYENVTDGIFQLDVLEGGRFRYAGINPALARMAGLVPADTTGRMIEEVMPLETARKMNANYCRCVEAAKPIQYEIELDLPDGLKTFESRLIPVRDGLGRIHRLIGLTHDITERKRTEQKIGFMNFMLDQMYDAVFLVDSHYRFRYVNDRACRSLSYSRDELLGMGVLDIDPLADDSMLQALAGQMADQGFLCFETFHRTKQGDKFPVEISASTIEFDGESMHLCVVRDATERNKLDDALFRHQLQLEEAQRIAHIGSWELDIVANVLFWSDETYRIFEIDTAQFGASYQAFIDLVHPDDRDQVERAYAESLSLRTHYKIEHRLLFADGRIKHVLEQAETDYDAYGRPLRSLGTVQDITERKRYESLIHERLTLERQVSLMADHIPGFLFTFKMDANGHGSFPYTSAGIQHIYGLKPSDVIEDMAPLHALAHPDDRPMIEAEIGRVVASFSPFLVEFRVNHPLKGECWIEAKSMPTPGPEGSVLYHGVMLDITERKRVDDTLKFLAQRGWMQGGESFLIALARHLGQLLQVDYVIIDKLAQDPRFAETVAIYAKGDVLPNMLYSLGSTPCENVMEGALCCYPAKVQQQFPEDALLVEMQVESYSGIPLWDSTGKVIGLMAVMDGKPMPDTAFITSMLQLVATRVVAEMERELSERGLLEARQFLSQVVDSIANPVFVKDRQHRWILLNQAFCEFIGHPMERMLGKSDYDFFPAHEADVFRAKDECVFNSGKEDVNEEELTDSNGITHTIITKKTCYTNHLGEQYLVGNILDITARKHYEMSLLKRVQLEEKLYGLAASVPGFIFTIRTDSDRHVSFPFASAGIEELFGLHPEDIREDAAVLRARYHPDDLSRVLAHMDETEKSLSPFRLEIRIFHPDKGMRWIEIRSTPQRHSDGSTEWNGLMIDITERKQMEAALSRQEHEFRALVENLPTAVVRYDRNFRRIYVNQGYLQIIGRSESDIIGTSAKEVWRADNMSAEAYMDVLAGVMQTGIKQEVSLEWTDSHGSLISHVMKIVPEYDAQGQVISALALGFDLSDRRQQQIVEAKRQSIFEKMAHGDPIDKILEQVALYVEYSKCGLHCSILLLDEDKKRLQMIAAPSFPDAYRVQLNYRLLDEESGHCYRWLASTFRSERVVVEDVSQHPCWKLCQSFVQEISKAACWSEPIFSSSNQLLGVVNIFSPQAGQPDIADLALIQQASYLSSIAIERNRIEQQMYRQASYDALTGLPNRRLFGDRLREEILKAERAGYRLAVLFIDLDRFKEVNDTLGHEAGDDLLVQAAERIRSCVRESDTVGRLGGDEFVLILPEVGEIAPLHRVAQSIVNVLARPFLIGEHQAYVSASIGVAGYPRDAKNAETLISCADQAMYAAKGTGRNSFSFFNPKMLAQAQQRLQLLNDLRGALDKGQLEVFYQPIINVNTGQAIKAEALLRWRHPDLGWISPDQFIPMAEETDLIHEIGNWVFCESANTAKRWHALHEDKAPYQISVNLSPRQFARGNPDVFCIDYLQTIGLDPAFMVIEITEGLLLDDQEDVMNKLRHFHQAGMQLALDDFGTGYSAMAYLKKFNIDYLKIDRSFVRDLEVDPSDRAIAEAIVAMAHRLGLKTIAEGVETEGQLNLLADAGCEYIQGYLFAKPMPVEVFLDYVQRQAHVS